MKPLGINSGVPYTFITDTSIAPQETIYKCTD